MSDPNGTAETLAPARFTADDAVRMHKTFPRQWPIAKLEKHKNLLLNSDFSLHCVSRLLQCDCNVRLSVSIEIY